MLDEHDSGLVLAAGIVCAVGVYASFALASHASRLKRRDRTLWAFLAILAAGCTAWATHFIVLLAFRPGVPAAFDPYLTSLSLLSAIAGIGWGMALALGSRQPWQRFRAGLVIGCGIITLHYLGQEAYLIQGSTHWNLWLVLSSMVIALPISGLALLNIGKRDRRQRWLAAPLLLLSIAVIHFCGMAAMSLRFDPAQTLPNSALSPETITPAVAGVSLALLALAVIGLRLDLTARARLKWERRRLSELASVALEGLLICDGDSVVAANTSAERLSGRSAGELTGANLGLLLPGLDFDSLPEREEREGELLSVGGDRIPVRVLRSEVRVGRKRQTVVAIRDQRERLRTEARMRTLAFSDALTGLPNRTQFFDLLARHTTSRREQDERFSVLMIDLDRFKQVNDSLGHAIGDLLLRKVADRLRSAVRDGDVLARLGGDEFAILQMDRGTPAADEHLAVRIVADVAARPFMLEGQMVHIGASVGIASSPADGHDPTELMRNADLALYAAKASGKGRLRRYDAELDERIRDRRLLEEGLRHAIANNELELHYQPLVEARTGWVTSAEALLRWRHPERGIISPTDFVGLAEETGLIVPLGEWIIRTACREAATWPADIAVAVNLSPVQFLDPALVSAVAGALKDAGLGADRLELEITEGVLLNEDSQTLDTLKKLKALGLRIAMGDFGTGYSSLSYLRRFPFDKIKIDQSFVRHAPTDEDCASIVRAIITMGRCLGLETTVEGVETTEQRDFAVREGCTFIQGYCFSPPLDPLDFKAFLATWSEQDALAA